jgi:hypothetical protein
MKNQKYSLIIATYVFLVLGIFLILLENGEKYINETDKSLKIEVFLKKNSPKSILSLYRYLSHLEEIEYVTFFSSRRARHLFPPVSSFQEVKYPVFFRVKLKEIFSFQKFKEIVDFITLHQEVEEVVYPENWLRRFFKIKSFFSQSRKIGLGVIVALSLMVLFALQRIISGHQKIKERQIFSSFFISAIVSLLLLFLSWSGLVYFKKIPAWVVFLSPRSGMIYLFILASVGFLLHFFSPCSLPSLLEEDDEK